MTTAVAIAKVAEHNAAERPREIAGGKRGERGHERHQRGAAWKERISNIAGEDAEDDEIVELERAAKAREQYDAPAADRNTRTLP